MKDRKVIQLEERVPKLKQQRQKRRKVNRRLILYVAMLFLLVLFVMYFRSPLSNIAHISVEGSHYMSEEEAMKLSGITYETSYLRVKTEEAERKLLQRKEIKAASIKKVLPNSIRIIIEEHKTIGYLHAEGGLYPLLEDGERLEALPSETLPLAAPVLFDFTDEKAQQELSKELKKLAPGIFRSISEIHLTPKPSDPFHLTLYMNEGYEVSATILSFSEKMAAYPLIIKKLQPNEKVRIHLEIGAYTEPLHTGEEKK